MSKRSKKDNQATTEVSSDTKDVPVRYRTEAEKAQSEGLDYSQEALSRDITALTAQLQGDLVGVVQALRCGDDPDLRRNLRRRIRYYIAFLISRNLVWTVQHEGSYRTEMLCTDLLADALWAEKNVDE